MTREHTDPGSIDDELRRRIAAAWAQGRPEPLGKFLPPEEDADYLAVLEGLVLIDLECAWRSWTEANRNADTALQGETENLPPLLERYLRQFQRLNEGEILLRLLQHEYSVRKKHGHETSIEEYRQRFPEVLGQFDLEIETPVTPATDALNTDPVFSAGLDSNLGRSSASSGDSVADAKPGSFGNYELLGEIGKGGMGVVYQARQRAAERIVALKVIRRDRLESLPRDSQANTVDRFWHEAQAAAQLQHDNIVTVYEVGEVDGQPFFSMRYVEGHSLSEILRQGPIDNRQAAAYMEPVVRAVQEAHLQGILHRDLKPQNILVDSKTGRALVADFGLAKLSQATDELTQAGEVFGTPAYMSPEQATDAASVTTATDVYALGATLYHLLTGRAPFQAATPVETLRQVIDVEPVPARQLNPSIDRDLETICSKCLEKEPARRYESAELLADDLSRYLQGEPILARPLSGPERTWRWCRRNPAVASLIASTIMALLLALIGTTVGLVRESVQREIAETAQQESEEGFRQAREMLDNLYMRVSEEKLRNLPGFQALRQQLLAEAQDYYQRFLSQRGDDPTLRDQLAVAHFYKGRITEEIGTAEDALYSYNQARRMQEQLVSESPRNLEHLRRLGDTLNAIGNVLNRQNKPNEARDAYQQAVTIRRRLAREEPEIGEHKRTLANTQMNIGLIEQVCGNREAACVLFDEAQALRLGLVEDGQESAQLERDLGKGYFSRARLALADGETGAARNDFEAATEAFENLIEQEPRDLDIQYRLALCYRILGDLAAGEGKMLHDEAETADDPELRLQNAGDKYREALDVYKKAIKPTVTLAQFNPDVTQYQAELAGIHYNRGVLQLALELASEADRSFQEALAVYQSLVEAYPAVGKYRADMAGLQLQIGIGQARHGDPGLAMESYRAAVDTFRDLVVRYPNVPDHQRDLAETILWIVDDQWRAGQYEAAWNNVRALRTYLQRLVQRYPDYSDFPQLLADTEDLIAQMEAEGAGPLVPAES